MRLRPRLVGSVLGLTAAFVALPALAADTGNGSKNFRTPSSVPNYFSNEAGPMQGPASETRRGEIYSGQTAQVQRAAAPVITAAPVRQHYAMAEPRGRLIRGRRGERVVAHHVIVHGRPVTTVASRGSSRVHTAYVAARTTHAVSRSVRSISRSTRVGATHRHARG